MINNKEILNLINEYEKEFSINNYNGDLTKTSSYTYLRGKIPIFLSAPHSVRHYRNKKLKKPEVYTGALVKMLHYITGCHVIYKNKNDGFDPNYCNSNNDGGYKNKIIQVIEDEDIKMFIDVHGMSINKFLDIDIGTDFKKTINHNYSITEILKIFFEKEGILNVGFDQIFTAQSNNTITKNTSLSTGIPCVQIEINRFYRDAKNNDNIIKLVNIFINIINYFNSNNL